MARVGGSPAGDRSSRPEYSRFAVLDPQVGPEQAISDIVTNLDGGRWQVVGYNCDFPTVSIMERETLMLVAISMPTVRLGIRYSRHLSTPLPSVDVPNPICP